MSDQLHEDIGALREGIKGLSKSMDLLREAFKDLSAEQRTQNAKMEKLFSEHDRVLSRLKGGLGVVGIIVTGGAAVIWKKLFGG